MDLINTVIALFTTKSGLMTVSRYAVQLIFIAVVCISVLVVYSYGVELRQQNSIYNKNKQKRGLDLKVITQTLFKTLSRNMKAIQEDKGKKDGFAENATLMIVGGLIAFGVFLLVNQQILLAVLAPFILFKVTVKVTSLMVETNAERIKKVLPYGIDTIIRSLSKTDDLKSVLYDASENLEEPLKTMFANMSIKMSQQGPKKVLEKFMEDNNNIWTYSLSFTLLSYLEDASKDDTVAQLRKLKGVIEKENKDANANKAEKKMTVAINYVLCVFGLLGLIGNVMFNPVAKGFFFSSLGGLACFLIGTSLLIVSVFSNLLLGKGKV